MNLEEALANFRFNYYENANTRSTLHEFSIYLILAVLMILLVVLLAIITRVIQIGN